MRRTTIALEDDVAAKLKAEMRRTGRSLKDTVNDALRFGLVQQARAQKQKPFKVHATPLGLRPGLSYDNIGLLLEQVEGPFHK